MKTLKSIRRWCAIDSGMKIIVTVGTVGYLAWAIKAIISDD